MKARGKPVNGPKQARKRPRTSVPPPAPILHRAPDGKLVKTKVVYSNGPKVKKVESVNSAWCGLPVYRSTISCGFSDSILNQYAEAIIMAVNQKDGRVPVDATAWCYGKIRLYLYAATYSHLAKIGSFSDDGSRWVKFGKYRVPTSFALALQDLGTFKDPETGAQFTPEFPDLTNSYYDALTSNNGSQYCPVITGYNVSFADEPTFGSGAVVTALTDTDCDIISNAISSAMKCVQTQYIGSFSNSAGSFAYDPGAGERFSVAKISNVSSLICLGYSNVQVAPHLVRQMHPVVGFTYSNDFGLVVSTHVLLCMDLDYEYKLRPWSGFAKFGVDPYNVQISFAVQSWSVLASLVIDWLINIGVFQSNAAVYDSAFNNWMNMAYAYLLAKTPFPGRRSTQAGTSPFYVSPSHLRVGMPSCIGNMGMNITRACDTIIMPFWPSWGVDQRSAMNTFISGNVYTPTFDNVPGSFPFSGTIPAGVLLAGLSPPSNVNLYNACYLAIKEELQNVERANINNQTVEYDINRPYCPCALTYVAGQNFNLTTFVVLPVTGVMTCYKPVGAVECKAQMGTSLDIIPAASTYFKSLSDVTQNRFRVVTEAAKFGNNVTQLVATNSGAAWKQASAGYFANLSSRIDWERGLLNGTELIKAAHEYIKLGGHVEGLPDPSFWSSLSTKDFNLEELVSKVASGITYVAPTVRAALAAYKAIRVHYPVV